MCKCNQLDYTRWQCPHPSALCNRHMYMCIDNDSVLITQDGDSVLMEAAYYGKTGAAKELLKAGANLNLQNNVSQSSTNFPFMSVCL
jgi:hypothetical protein